MVQFWKILAYSLASEHYSTHWTLNLEWSHNNTTHRYIYYTQNLINNINIYCISEFHIDCKRSCYKLYLLVTHHCLDEVNKNILKYECEKIKLWHISEINISQSKTHPPISTKLIVYYSVLFPTTEGFSSTQSMSKLWERGLKGFS